MPESDTDSGPEQEPVSVQPMLPRTRQRWRAGHPPQAIPVRPEVFDEPDWGTGDRAGRRRRQDLDPVFGYILAMALSVGLLPVPANTRYVVLWAFMAAMGGMAFVLGSGIRLKVTDPGDLLWGIGLGALTGGALVLVGADTLAVASGRLFGQDEPSRVVSDTWVFQATVFAMPVAESLFFRGAMQRVYSLPVVAVLASLWSVVMFFPHLELGQTAAVGVIFGTAIALLNFLYGYIHWRHGLAASFFCQITAGSLLLFVPRLLV